jgi:hypothetical protein
VATVSHPLILFRLEEFKLITNKRMRLLKKRKKWTGKDNSWYSSIPIITNREMSVHLTRKSKCPSNIKLNIILQWIKLRLSLVLIKRPIPTVGRLRCRLNRRINNYNTTMKVLEWRHKTHNTEHKTMAINPKGKNKNNMKI